MTFRRYGRSFHLVMKSASDLRRALQLDEAHCVAISAPVESFHIDPVFLQLLDCDNDNLIKVAEFKGSIRWLLERLSDTSGVDTASTTLKLSSINRENREGELIGNTLAKLLAHGSTPQRGEVTLEEIRRLEKELENQSVSEAGVVPPSAGDDPSLQQFLSDILATVGGVDHPGNQCGVNRAKLEEFKTQAGQYLAWYELGQVSEDRPVTAVMPLGQETADAFECYVNIRDKIDQYFVQCEVLALDGSLKQKIWPRGEVSEVQADMTDISQIREILKRSPIAEPTPERTLRFDCSLNPHYRQHLNALRETVIVPLLGTMDSTLSEADWHAVKERLREYDAWYSGREGECVAKLGVEKLRRYLDGEYVNQTLEMIQQCKDSRFDLENVRMAEKLALYQGHLLRMANNFISFPDLYDPNQRALFEEGSLVMDGRRFNLAVRVHDRNEHMKVTKRGTMFVMYVQIEQKSAATKYEIAVPVTAGTQGNLAVGKRGVFEHLDGTQWAARVVQLVDQPISLLEALWTPFRRLGRAIVAKIEAITASAEKEMEKAGAESVGQLREKAVAARPTGAQAAAAPPPPAGAAGQVSPMGIGGMLAGGGIAVAALGSSLAFIVGKLGELNSWQILGGLGGAILAVLLPTSIISFLRLRRRDLSSILEGSGWAINARMRLSRRQRHYFTQKPRYLTGSRFRRWAHR